MNEKPFEVQLDESDFEEVLDIHSTSLQDFHSENTELFDEGTINPIEAKQREGKTLAMSILTKEELLVNKREVLSNIPYTFPWKPLNFFDLELDTDVVNKVLSIDELNFYLDARAAMTKINQRFCVWLLQSKKGGNVTYGTTHDLFYLDLRFRDNFDYLIKTLCYWVVSINGQVKVFKERPKGLVPKNTPPTLLKIEKWNGPNQRKYHNKNFIDFRKKPHLLGMFNTRNKVNIFQELEAYKLGKDSRLNEKPEQRKYNRLGDAINEKWRQQTSSITQLNNAFNSGVLPS